MFAFHNICGKDLTKKMLFSQFFFQYFPPSRYMWYFYCLSVTVVLAVIKLVNYGLHHMYDTSECIHEEVEENWHEEKRYIPQAFEILFYFIFF